MNAEHIECPNGSVANLRLMERRRLAFVLYPLSGGFSRRSLVPERAYRPLALVEQLLRPFSRLLAFRCLVVIERASGDADRR